MNETVRQVINKWRSWTNRELRNVESAINVLYSKLTDKSAPLAIRMLALKGVVAIVSEYLKSWEIFLIKDAVTSSLIESLFDRVEEELVRLGSACFELFRSLSSIDRMLIEKIEREVSSSGDVFGVLDVLFNPRTYFRSGQDESCSIV